MKANAPERLYLSKNIYSTYLYQVPDPDDKTAVEYTRIDAFIEKATLWLLTNASDYCNLHNSYDTKELVEDFVNAMKRD